MIRSFNHTIFYGVLGLLLLTWNMVNAQFLRFSMEVETELSARNESKLNFGNMASGTRELSLNDDGIGIFSISAYQNVHVNISIETPGYLLNSMRGNNDQLEVVLNSAYANEGENNYKQAISMTDNKARFPVRESSGARRSIGIERCWLYIYGTITAGDVSPGIYEGDVVVHIEYE
ncbi:MAG: hypothetical protein WD267_11365 [Balneolales bacterium]